MNRNKRANLRNGLCALAFAVAVFGLGSAGCDEPKKEGPLERAGERVDESVNDAKRAVEDATD